MNIQEFRQKYPEYNDMSDKDLADKFHGKYYSDIPKDEFYTKFGISAEKPTSGIDEGALQQSLKGFSNVGKDAFSKFESFSGGLPVKPPAPSNFVAGAGQSVQNVGNLLSGGAIPMADQAKWESALGINNPNAADRLAQGIGGYLPFGLAGGAGLLGQTLAGGAYGLSQGRPGQENLMGLLPEGKVGAAIEGAGLNALAGGVAKAFEATRPSNLLRGNLPDEELIANAKAAEGTTTGLGDVIGSPFLKRQYENVISKLPFSGANAKLQQAAQAVESKGNAILNTMLGKNNPDTVNEQLSGALMNEYKKHQAVKNIFYDKANKIADESGFALDSSNFAKTASKFSKAIEDTTFLKHEPDMASIYNKLQNYKRSPTEITETKGNILGPDGIPIITDRNVKTTRLQEANLLKSRLETKSRSLKASPEEENRSLGEVFGQLALSLRGDIAKSIKNTGNPALKKEYFVAERNYAQNFSPFLDKDIYKFIGGKNTDSDTLVSTFLSQSKTSDRANLLSKFMNKLPENEKNLVGFSYLSRAVDKEGNLNPGKLNTLIDKLGKNQFKALIPDPVMRKSLMDYSRLYKMNTKAVNLMQNPATGQQNLDILPAALTHSGAAMMGGAVGGLPGALAGLVVPGLMSKPLVNMLTSGKTRENLIKAMLANKPLNLPVQQTQAALQGLNQ